MTEEKRDRKSGANDNADPKLDPARASNRKKDPADRVAGDEPMTGAQASDLRTLSAQAREPEAFSEHLTKAEASARIGALRAKLRLLDGPPHTL